MAQLMNVAGTPIRLNTTGTTSPRSGSGILLGMSCPANTTGSEVSIWAAVTASGATGAIFTLPTTSAFLQCPMDAPNGFTVRVTGAASPDLTLYWMPT